MAFDTPNGPLGQHEAVEETVKEAIVEVSREALDDPDKFGIAADFSGANPNELTDQEILQLAEWDGGLQRRKKWLFMAAETVRQATQVRDKQQIQTSNHENGLGQFTSGATDLDWQSLYSQSADVVAYTLAGPDCAQTIRSALRRETFQGRDSDIKIPVDVPREVLRRVEQKLRSRNDVNTDEVIAKHREAIDWENQDKQIE